MSNFNRRNFQRPAHQSRLASGKPPPVDEGPTIQEEGVNPFKNDSGKGYYLINAGMPLTPNYAETSSMIYLKIAMGFILAGMLYTYMKSKS